jgi:hypothetical protein
MGPQRAPVAGQSRGQTSGAGRGADQRRLTAALHYPYTFAGADGTEGVHSRP